MKKTAEKPRILPADFCVNMHFRENFGKNNMHFRVNLGKNNMHFRVNLSKNNLHFRVNFGKNNMHFRENEKKQVSISGTKTGWNLNFLLKKISFITGLFRAAFYNIMVYRQKF